MTIQCELSKEGTFFQNVP